MSKSKHAAKVTSKGLLDEVRSHAQVVLPSERIEIIENDPAASGT